MLQCLQAARYIDAEHPLLHICNVKFLKFSKLLKTISPIWKFASENWNYLCDYWLLFHYSVSLILLFSYFRHMWMICLWFQCLILPSREPLENWSLNWPRLVFLMLCNHMFIGKFIIIMFRRVIAFSGTVWRKEGSQAVQPGVLWEAHSRAFCHYGG